MDREILTSYEGKIVFFTLANLVDNKENRNNYLTIKDTEPGVDKDENEFRRRKSDSSQSTMTKSSSNIVKPLKFVKFLNVASSFWSKKLCLGNN